MSVIEMLEVLSVNVRLATLKSAILELRPELDVKVHTVKSGHSGLTVETGGDNRLVVAFGKMERDDDPAWAIFTPGVFGTDTWWSASLPDEAIANALLAILDHVDPATHQVMPLAGLVRWQEPERCLATDLADALDARGVEVLDVVGTNRLAQRYNGTEFQRRTVGEDVGQAVRIRCAWGQPTIAFRDVVGWVMGIPAKRFVNDHALRWPFPPGIGRALFSADRLPGHEVLEHLVDVVTERASMTMDQFWERDDRRMTFRVSPLEDALKFLELLGLRNASYHIYDDDDFFDLRDAVLLVHRGDKQLGKPLLTKRLGEIYGTRKPAVFLSASRYSRDARAMADSAGLMLFTYNEYGLHAQSRSAHKVAVKTIPADSDGDD